MDELKCHLCKEILPKKYFSKSKKSRTGYKIICKTCSRAQRTVKGKYIKANEPDEECRKRRQEKVNRLEEFYDLIPRRLMTEPCCVVDAWIENKL